jgi:hypothetical protein
MKNYNGLEDWMDKVKQSLDDIPNKPARRTTIDCEEIDLPETVRSASDHSVLRE